MCLNDSLSSLPPLTRRLIVTQAQHGVLHNPAHLSSSSASTICNQKCCWAINLENLRFTEPFQSGASKSTELSGQQNQGAKSIRIYCICSQFQNWEVYDIHAGIISIQKLEPLSPRPLSASDLSFRTASLRGIENVRIRQSQWIISGATTEHSPS